jgi:hypothetical protein
LRHPLLIWNARGRLRSTLQRFFSHWELFGDSA